MKVRVTIPALRATAKKRPPGYFEDVLSRGVVIGNVVEFTSRAYRDLIAKYRRVEPAKDWPAWALAAATLAEPEDAGVGDTIVRLVGGAGTEGFKRHHEAVFGVMDAPCGCWGEVARWNALYPYA